MLPCRELGLELVLIVKVRVASFENIFYIVKQMLIGGGVIKVEEKGCIKLRDREI